MSDRRLYEFRPFRLDPAERRLLRDGEPVALTPKCFDLLVVLVENGGHLLEKEVLLGQVWPNQFVEEGSLSFHISELRRALGEGRDGTQYIETVRKKGYRFVAPVDEVYDAVPPAAGHFRAAPGGAANHAAAGEPERTDDADVGSRSDRQEAPSRAWRAALFAVLAAGLLGLLLYLAWARHGVVPVERPPRTIAVLPFKPLVATARDEPLEMGICHALIVRLGGVDQLTVRPTSSVVRYAGPGHDPLAAGRALGADALVDGYIERSGDRIRVTAQLLRTEDGKPLWSGQFDEKFTDIFSVEDSISTQMVEALRLNLAGDERDRVTRHATEHTEAYELYLKGLYFQEKRTPDGVQRSARYFEQATEKDPKFGVAFAALAESYIILAIRADMPLRDSRQQATAAAVRAVELDETSAEAHNALAQVKFWYDWDWQGAEREFALASELSRNRPLATQYYAAYLVAMGRDQDAVAEIRRAQRLAPLSLNINVQSARILFFAREYDEAIDQCRTTLEMDPDYPAARLFLGRTLAQKGRYPEALVELERSRELYGESAEVLALIGHTYAAAGRRPEARRVLRELDAASERRYVSPYHLAMIHAGLGETQRALDLLERAFEDREGRMTILKCAPEFDTLRAEPRFTALLRRLRLDG